jgi:signal transduction histidine kinase
MGQSPPDLQDRVAALESLMSHIRHDVRSALAPALLAADMMQASPDTRAQRSGATVVRAIERVLVMLDATRDVVPPRPDAPVRPQ